MPQSDITCEHCGFSFHFDHTKRCWQCDSLMCIYCLTEPPQPLCPECSSSLPTVEPMLAELSKIPSDAAKWGFEFKWDGIRAIYYWNGQKSKILSRNMINITSRYPELSDLGKKLGSVNAIFDGEIVALDSEGRPDFKILQKRMHLSQQNVSRVVPKVPVYYYIFDCLLLENRSLIKLPYEQRRQILEGLNIRHSRCLVPPSFREAKIADDLLAAARENGLEGIIAKRLDSQYLPGQRSNLWCKIKIVKSHEFIIGGWIAQENNSKRIGSLLLGCYDKQMKLQYVGNVGSGFSDTDHELLLVKLKSLERPYSGFADKSGKRYVHYIEPVLVADIEYRRWPADGNVQQAAFKGLRTDKDPHEIFREENT